MKPDDEIRKSYSIQKDDDLIILSILRGDDDPEDNTRTSELILEDLSKALPFDTTKKINLLTDLTPAGKISYASEKSKELFANSPIFKRFSKVAVVSTSLALRALSIYLTTFTGKFGNMELFKDREKAIAWLKGSS
jgi:hypothetical protein